MSALGVLFCISQLHSSRHSCSHEQFWRLVLLYISVISSRLNGRLGPILCSLITWPYIMLWIYLIWFSCSLAISIIVGAIAPIGMNVSMNDISLPMPFDAIVCVGLSRHFLKQYLHLPHFLQVMPLHWASVYSLWTIFFSVSPRVLKE